MRAFRLVLLALVLSSPSLVQSADSPQFRGPKRDGRFPETGLLRKWPENGPALLWSVDGLGGGWTSASVAGDTVYVAGMDKEQQGWLFAFGLDGSPKWKAPFGPEAEASRHPGARSTPTVDGDRVYVMSGNGRLVCFDAKSGKGRFAVDTLDRFQGEQIRWAIAESVLVDGDRVICTPGGPDASLVALNKMTGETVWTTKGLSEASAYCSPIIVTHGNRRLILTMLKDLIVGVDADSGEFLWKYPRPHKNGVLAVTPAYGDGLVCGSTGRTAGSVGLALSADGANITPKWENKTLNCQHHGIVLVDGYVYGTAQGPQQLVCLKLQTGKTMWTAGDTGKGVVVYADGMLYVYSEKGDMYLIRATPDAFEPVSRFTIEQGTGEHWAHPTIANGRLYIRHGDALMVYDLKGTATR